MDEHKGEGWGGQVKKSAGCGWVDDEQRAREGSAQSGEWMINKGQEWGLQVAIEG